MKYGRLTCRATVQRAVAGLASASGGRDAGELSSGRDRAELAPRSAGGSRPEMRVPWRPCVPRSDVRIPTRTGHGAYGLT
jgi:hypothetical protein